MDVEDRELEAAVSDMLARRRPVRPVPAGVRTRVVSVVDSPPVRSTLWRFGLSVASLAGVVVVVAVVGYIALYVRPNGVPQPGASPSPTTPRVFDINATDIGIVYDVADTLHFLPWLVAGGIALALGAVVLGSQDWRRRLAAAVLTAIAVASAGLIAGQPGFVFGYASGPISGLSSRDVLVIGDTKDEFYITAQPTKPFGVLFNVRNGANLPVQLLGVIGSGPELHSLPHWTAVWLRADSPDVLPASSSRLFDAPTLAPGESLWLYLVGRAGDCALGGVPPAEFSGGASITDQVKIAYSVLGMTGVSNIDLPLKLIEYQRPDCTGAPDETPTSSASP